MAQAAHLPGLPPLRRGLPRFARHFRRDAIQYSTTRRRNTRLSRAYGNTVMPWVRFDDQFTIHRKIAGLSDAAFRLHVSAIFWCARNLTDGFLPEEDLGDVCARVRTPARFAAECVGRRAWHHSGETCPSGKCPAHEPGRPECAGPVDNPVAGWLIHDYWEYQPAKSQVLRDREAAARRQKAWRDRRNAVSNGVTGGVTNTTPPRPAPKGSGAGKAPAPARAAGGRAEPAGSAARVAEKPPWCGQCDRESRFIDPKADPLVRCPRCHHLQPVKEAL